eukprot:CAMPEP_0173221098 /NCGR_PEP_ID=MMETSP1142-20121109/2535_1 /TAXON_ID=483371 /ORGANISM="non described non described, Strain CCMP2298" /LENGTH=135 /DNA_ID=CAMNT_0014149097 /DNA_START=220 /DNA_END=622 /DNA_ORIENTATION=+
MSDWVAIARARAICNCWERVGCSASSLAISDFESTYTVVSDVAATDTLCAASVQQAHVAHEISRIEGADQLQSVVAEVIRAPFLDACLLLPLLLVVPVWRHSEGFILPEGGGDELRDCVGFEVRGVGEVRESEER